MDSKKEIILKATRDLIALYGFKKTTMDEIATRAGMAKSSIYYYFKSKEEIFSELVSLDSIAFQKKLQTVVDKADTPQEKILSYVKTRMTHLRDLSEEYRTFRDEYNNQYPFIDQVRSEFYHFENSVINSIIETGIEKGLFILTDVQLAVRMMTIVFKGLERQLVISDLDNLERDVKFIVELFFKGLEKR